MKFSQKLLFAFGLLLLTETFTNAFIGSLPKLLRTSKKVFDRVFEAGATLKDISEIGELVSDVVRTELLGEDEEPGIAVADISSQLNRMMNRIESRFNTVNKKLDELPAKIEMDTIERDILNLIEKIWNFYDEAYAYSKNIEKYNEIQLKQFANAMTSLEDGSLSMSLANLHNYISPKIDIRKSYLDHWNDYVKLKGDTLCGELQSTSQRMYHFYEIIVITETIGHIALEIGFVVQKIAHKVDTSFGLQEAQNQSESRLATYFREFKKSITQTSNVLRPCDPTHLTRDVTYIEMENLFQKVVTHSYHKRSGCSDTCENLDLGHFELGLDKMHAFNCDRLYQCRAIGDLDYCLLDDDGLRLYQWIKENNVTYGDSSPCRGTEYSMASWTKPSWTSTDWTCDVCLCTCYSKYYLHNTELFSTMFIDVRGIASDYKSNMVVTGLQFVKLGPNTITISIKEGFLLPGGKIQEGSESWLLDTNEFINKRGIPDKGITPLVNRINLDDITVTNKVVIGIQLQQVEAGPESFFQFNLLFADFDYDTGKLLGEEIVFPDVRNGELLNTPDADSPLAAKSDQNIPQPTGGNYIKFGPSGLQGDAGQTTIPLLDAQPVESNPPAPLSGVGLFFKSTPGYGGFLGFRIHTLNQGQYMKEEE